jgi:hypothetical protein
MKSLQYRIEQIGNLLTELLVSPPRPKFNWDHAVILGFLYAVGLLLWWRFLSWGKVPMTFHDWSEITGPRLTVLQDAMLKGTLPFHTANTATFGGITTRFMAVPDVILSPQIFLLRYLSLGAFVILQISLMYTLGFWGLLQVRRRFSLSLLPFTVLFSLFNFNGHILAHFSVGHLTWGGYFLFPWFALLVFDLLDDHQGWKWVAQVALLLLVMLLQGSYHHFTWCLFFLGFLAVFSIHNLVPILKAMVFAVLASLVRLLPPFILLGKFHNQFLGGYRDFLSIMLCLVTSQIPRSTTSFEDVSGGLPTWESTIYLGILGAVFLLYFGFKYSIANAESNKIYRMVILPALCLVLLSNGPVYQFLRTYMPLPLLTGERIASRMISLPVVFILILAVIEFQNHVVRMKGRKLFVPIMILLILLGAVDLWQNYDLWSVHRAASEFAFQGYTPSQWYVSNDFNDTSYLRLIGLGAAVSVATLSLLFIKVWKEKIHPTYKGAKHL